MLEERSGHCCFQLVKLLLVGQQQIQQNPESRLESAERRLSSPTWGCPFLLLHVVHVPYWLTWMALGKVDSVPPAPPPVPVEAGVSSAPVVLFADAPSFYCCGPVFLSALISVGVNNAACVKSRWK